MKERFLPEGREPEGEEEPSVISWMPETVSRWSTIFKRASEIHGLPRGLLDKIALYESAGSCFDISVAGAQGICQVMPENAPEVSVSVWTYTDFVLRMGKSQLCPKARPSMSDNLVLQAYKVNGMKCGNRLI